MYGGMYNGTGLCEKVRKNIILRDQKKAIRFSKNSVTEYILLHSIPLLHLMKLKL